MCVRARACAMPVNAVCVSVRTRACVCVCVPFYRCPPGRSMMAMALVLFLQVVSEADERFREALKLFVTGVVPSYNYSL